MLKSRFLASAAALALLMGAAFAKVELNLNVTEGQSISGDFQIRASVRATNLVTSVEFSINDDLRESDDSTPYTFSIDTIAEKEGPIRLKVSAYTSEGETATKVVNLNIDNDVAKGADFHVERGQELLAQKKWDEAIVAGRIALKAKERFSPAKLLLARANLGKGVFDLAQKFVDEVLVDEKDNLDALDLRGAISLQRAFTTMARGDRKETVATIKSALEGAASARAKVYEARLEALGAVTDANFQRIVDVALAAGRYNRAATILESRFQLNPEKANISNRYIFALLRGGRFTDAVRALGTYERRGRLDATGYALKATIHQLLGQNQQSLDAERMAITADASDLTVRSAQVMLASSRSNFQAMSSLVRDLAKDEGQRPEVMLFQSIVFNAASEFESARQMFESAVLAEPTSSDAYIIRANQLIGFSLNSATARDDVAYQRQLAKAYFDAALSARPESFEALTGLSLLALINGETAESVRLGEAATKAGPQYAAGHFMYAHALQIETVNARKAAEDFRQKAAAASANRLTEEAAKLRQASAQSEARARELEGLVTRALNSARQADPAGLQGRAVGPLLDAWIYFAGRGRTPLLIQPQF